MNAKLTDSSSEKKYNRTLTLDVQEFGKIAEWAVVKTCISIRETQKNCTITYKEYSNNIDHIEKTPTLTAKKKIERNVVNDLFSDILKIDFNKIIRTVNFCCDGVLYNLSFTIGLNSIKISQWCPSNTDFNNLCEKIVSIGKAISKNVKEREGWRMTIDEFYEKMKIKI